MKNHKGAVATLLTLGLVIVGSLITLGTSLFVNNQKTNLASNSMAAINCTSLKCTTGNTNRTIYKRANGTFWSDPGCTGESGYGTLCGVGNGGVTMTPAPGSGGNGSGGNGDLCGQNSGYCEFAGECAHKVSSTAATNYCKNENSGYVCCQNNGGSSGAVPTQGAGSSGSGAIVGEGQSCCFEKKRLVYVFATYKTMLDSDMLNDNGEVDCGRQSASVISSYQANKDKGAFVCPGGTKNKTPIDQFVPVDEEPTPGNSSLIAPEGCEKFPVGGCGMYWGTTRIKKTVEGVTWCCLSKKKVTPTPTLSANENVCENTNPKYKCTAGGDAQICQKKLNLSCGVENTNQTCCDYNSGNRAVGTGTPQPLPSTSDGEIGDCSKYVPDTCPNYCAQRGEPYSKPNSYYVKDSYRSYDDTSCRFITSIYTYCGCSFQQKDDLIATKIDNNPIYASNDQIEKLDCSSQINTQTQSSSKNLAEASCSSCGSGWLYNNKPRCLLSKENNLYSAHCCPRQN